MLFLQFYIFFTILSSFRWFLVIFLSKIHSLVPFLLLSSWLCSFLAHILMSLPLVIMFIVFFVDTFQMFMIPFSAAALAQLIRPLTFQHISIPWFWVHLPESWCTMCLHLIRFVYWLILHTIGICLSEILFLVVGFVFSTRFHLFVFSTFLFPPGWLLTLLFFDFQWVKLIPYLIITVMIADLLCF